MKKIIFFLLIATVVFGQRIRPSEVKGYMLEDSTITADKIASGGVGLSNLSNAIKYRIDYDNAVYIKDYGAVGDGVATDTDSIQAAIDYAEANNKRTIIFNKGTYLIDSCIVFQGMGWRIISPTKDAFIKSDSANWPDDISGIVDREYMIALRADSPQGWPDSTAINIIDGLNIISNGNSDSSSTANTFTYGPGGIIARTPVIVQNCYFEGLWKEACMSTGSNYPSSVSILGGGRSPLTQANFFDNRFYNCNHNALNFNGTPTGIIRGNIVQRCYQGVEAIGWGMTIDNNIFYGCRYGVLIGEYNYDTPSQNRQGVIVSNNIVVGDTLDIVPARGIHYWWGTSGAKIHNNYIRFFSSVGIGVSLPTSSYNQVKTEDVHITNNDIYDPYNTTPGSSNISGIYIGVLGNVNDSVYINNVKISGGIIKNTNHAFNLIYGIYINGQALKGNMQISNVYIENPLRVGVYAANSWINDWRFSDVNIKRPGQSGFHLDNDYGTGFGVELNNCTVDGPGYWNNTDSPIGTSQRGFYLYGLKWPQLKNCTVENLFNNDDSTRGPRALELATCEDALVNNFNINRSPYAIAGRATDITQSGATKGTFSEMRGGAKIAFSTAQPTFGRWIQGSMVYDTTPAAADSIYGWVCLSPTNGWGAASEDTTTGSISASEKILTVASGSGWQIGDAIKIAGAGVASADLSTIVEWVGGTTIRLYDAASTTVSGNNVTHIPPTWNILKWGQ